MKLLFERIGDCSTPRKCESCQQAASYWKFSVDTKGGKDKSSRVPVCEKHSGGER
jgi:hypothetical protein